MDNERTGEKSSLAKIRNGIITGLFIIIPVGVTCWLGWIVFNALTEWSKPIIRQIEYFSPFESAFWFNALARIFSLVLILTVLFCVGQIAKFAAGRRLMLYGENIILGIPMANSVYSTIRQIVDAVKGTAGGGMFSQVVLIEFPRKGLYAIAFITNENISGNEITQKTGKNLINVFMPTTPNPTSGFLLFIPREDCIFLDMGVREGMKLLISGGVISPEIRQKRQDEKNNP